MRSFTDIDATIGLVPFAIVSDLRVIDAGRGSEALYREKLPGLLTSLADRARVASIEASSAIEGVVVKNSVRAAAIVAGTVDTLRDRSEQELAGYRSALDYLYQEEWQPLNPGLLLHLHRVLFAYTTNPGGSFKESDNLVVDRLPDGSLVKRFTPVSALRTPEYVEELIDQYNRAMTEGRHHPLLLAGLFALDLLTVHPFTDGNGRITRALTNALLQQGGYEVTRYVSLETLIAASSDAYYATLGASTAGWHGARHDPWPWLAYFVGTVRRAYEEFASLTSGARSGGNKRDRVRDYVLHHAPTRFRVSDIRTALPGISTQTIHLALGALKEGGLIEAESVGRGATWVRRR